MSPPENTRLRHYTWYTLRLAAMGGIALGSTAVAVATFRGLADEASWAPHPRLLPATGLLFPLTFGMLALFSGKTEADPLPAPPELPIPVPARTLEALVQVAAYVSSGAGYRQTAPYPDATARRALGELDDLGLLRKEAAA
jgi:hypothetical protein